MWKRSEAANQPFPYWIEWNTSLSQWVSLNNDLSVTILQNKIKTAAARRYHEDKRICKLKTLAPHGLNTGDYAK